MDRKIKKVGLFEVWKDTFRDFTEWTSLVGLSNANKSSKQLNRYMWMCIFCVGALATIYNIHSVITSYLSYPYYNKNDYVKHSSLEFPAVTICNQNRVSCYNLFDAMLEEIVSKDEKETLKFKISDYPLFQLYNESKCGSKIMNCETVLRSYINYNFSRNKENEEIIPKILLDNDVCMDCKIIRPEIKSVCKDWWLDGRKENSAFERLKFAYSYLKCDYEFPGMNFFKHASEEFPAVIGCYNNIVSCKDLFYAMLETVDHQSVNEATNNRISTNQTLYFDHFENNLMNLETMSANETFYLDNFEYNLIDLYRKTQCGPLHLGCNTVLYNYVGYNYSSSEGIPNILFNDISCDWCANIKTALLNLCGETQFEEEEKRKFKRLLSSQRYLDCDQRMVDAIEFTDILHVKKEDYIEHSLPEFPPATFCYHRINSICHNLLDAMLIEIDSMSGNKTTESTLAEHPYLALYNETQCGTALNDCQYNIEKYITFKFSVGENIPEILLQYDKCLSCNEIKIKMCNDYWLPNIEQWILIQHANRRVRRLNYISQFQGCDTKLEVGLAALNSSSHDCSQTTLEGFAPPHVVSPVYPDEPRFIPPPWWFQKSDFGNEDYSMTYETLSVASKLRIGYSYDEFILNCSFLESACSSLQSNFIKTISSTYGVCYTFNLGGEEHTSIAGSSFSLHLHLNINQTSYLPRLGSSRQGVRLAIHPPRTLPSLEEAGIDVPVNMATTISIKKLNIVRLKTPFKPNCTSSWDETPFVLDSNPNVGNFTNLNNVIYSSEYCIRMCLQHYFIKTCSCYHSEYPIGFWFRDQHHINVRNCNTSSESNDSKCIFSQSNTTEVFDASACDCNEACNDSTYQLSSSFSNWPSTQSKDDVTSYYNANNITVEGNLLQLDIFYSSMSVETHSQVPQYNGFADYVSSLGGALSLYLGISIVLVAEVFEFLILVCRSTILYFLGRHHLQIEPPLTEKKVKLTDLKQKEETMESERF